jgi:hypothetical protein
VSRPLADLTLPEAERSAAEGVLAIPVGATEQHGPHLPLLTDTRLYGLDSPDAFARQQPHGRLLEPEEIAAMLVWLAGPACGSPARRPAA